MSKVRVAILGCGGMAGAHARRLAPNPDVQIVALSDVDEPRVESFIQKHLSEYDPKPAIFTDPAQMYAEAKPDGVVIVTPHTLHFEHGMQALDAGCHVLMEKPMVTDAGQAHQLAARGEGDGQDLRHRLQHPLHAGVQIPPGHGPLQRAG